MRLLINQPGKVGDIICCLPIAKWYADRGYEVSWLCPEIYHSLFDYVDYVKPVTAMQGVYQIMIDLSFGLNQKSSLHKRWLHERATGKSFVDYKYELAGVPLSERWNLQYDRKMEREEELEKELCSGISYSLIHIQSDYGSRALIETDFIELPFTPFMNFTIFDWRMVIENASEIHCIDSSLCNFVDRIETEANLFYYITDRVPTKGDRTVLQKNWNVINLLEKEMV